MCVCVCVCVCEIINLRGRLRGVSSLFSSIERAIVRSSGPLVLDARARRLAIIVLGRSKGRSRASRPPDNLPTRIWRPIGALIDSCADVSVIVRSIHTQKHSRCQAQDGQSSLPLACRKKTQQEVERGPIKPSSNFHPRARQTDSDRARKRWPISISCERRSPLAFALTASGDLCARRDWPHLSRRVGT